MNHLPNPEFDAIVTGLNHEMRDPVVTALFESVLEAEIALNSSGGRISESQIAEVTAALNNELQAYDLYRANVYLSGRLRVAGDIDDDFIDSDFVPPEIEALGAKRVDETGPYYQVSRYPAVIGDFEVVSVSEMAADGSPRLVHRIYQQFTTSVEDDPSSGWLFGYPTDLESYEPQEPSIAKRIKDLTEHYPDIIEQLKSLPEDCEDDETLYRALDDLALTIDWSRHSRLTDDERSEVVEAAVHYVTNRLWFDSDLYAVSIEGPVYSLGRNSELLSHTLDSRTDLRGMIGNIRLVGNTVEGDTVTYLPELELMASVGRRGGGNTLVYVPVTSIVGLKNLRNIPLFDGDGVAEYAAPETNLELPPTSASKQDSDMENEADTYEEGGRKAELIALEERIHHLFEACRLAGEETYASHEQAEESIQELREYIDVFMRLFPTGTALELSGEGVLHVPMKREVQVDEEENAVTIKYSNPSLTEAGVFSRNGMVREFYVGLMASDDEDDAAEGAGRIRAMLLLTDLEKESVIPLAQSETFRQSFYTIYSQRTFAAEIREEVTAIVIPELERLRDIDRRIESISQSYADLEELPSHLRALHNFVEDAKADAKFVSLEDVSIVNAIGDSVGGDELASRAVTVVLGTIIADREVVVSGPMYQEDGTHIETNGVRGMVSDVVDSTDILLTREPMFRLVTEGSEVFYVPLSSLEQLSA